MIKKDKDNLNKQKNTRAKKIGYFIFIVLFVILVIIQFLQYVDKKPVENRIDNFDSPSVSNEIIQVEDNVDKFEDNLNYAEDFCDSFYNNLDEDEIVYYNCSDHTNPDDINKKLDQYRIFLANADRMISKFKNNEDYAFELKNFSVIEHPEEIKNILNMLKIYNDQLMLEQNSTQEIILFPNNNFLSKLFKITKISVEDNKYFEMKKQILEKLTIFSDYIYATDLQNKFLGQK